MNAPVKRKTGNVVRQRSNETIVRGLVMRHAEGNVKLHQGRYMTQRDVDTVVTRALSRDLSVHAKKK